MAGIKGEFDQRDTRVVSLSVDPMESHRLWLKDIADVTGHDVNFPMIADADQKVARLKRSRICA